MRMVFPIELFDICYCNEKKKREIFAMGIACFFVCLVYPNVKKVPKCKRINDKQKKTYII